jgi:hypothetical protein
MVLGVLAQGFHYQFSCRALYRELWRIDDEELSLGW